MSTQDATFEQHLREEEHEAEVYDLAHEEDNTKALVISGALLLVILIFFGAIVAAVSTDSTGAKKERIDRVVPGITHGGTVQLAPISQAASRLVVRLP
jgi:hypothetical protein